MTVLAELVSRCRHLLVCDQDLNSSLVKAFVETMRSTKQYRVFHNTYSPWADPDIRSSNQPLQLTVVEGPLAREAVVQKLLETVKEENAKRLRHGDASPRWSGTHVVCHSLIECEAIFELVAQELGFDEEEQQKYLATYTSNTPEHIKLRDLCDAKVAWAQKVMVSNTSTISVGTDFNHPRIKFAFVLLCSDNLAVPQSLQMMLRCRQLNQAWLAFRGFRQPHAYPHEEKDIMQWMETSVRARALVPTMYNVREQPHLNPLVKAAAVPELRFATLIAKSLEFRLWLAFVVERCRSQRDFMSRFLDLADRVGLRVEVTQAADCGISIESFDQVYAQKCAAHGSARERHLAKIAAEVPSALERKQKGIQIEGALTSAEKAGILGLGLMEVFGVPLAAVQNIDWLAYWEPYREEFLLAKSYFSGFVSVPRGFNSKHASTSSASERIQVLRRVLACVGVQLEDLQDSQRIQQVRTVQVNTWRVQPHIQADKKGKPVLKVCVCVASVCSSERVIFDCGGNGGGGGGNLCGLYYI